MFYYLLARNCNMKKDAEEIASISALKYIGLLIVTKIIELRYSMPGFFNYYILAFIAFDIIFSLYRYQKVADSEARDINYCTDDVINDDFSVNDYENEINEIRTKFHKRKQTISKTSNNDTNKEAEEFNINDNVHIPATETSIINTPKPTIIDMKKISLEPVVEPSLKTSPEQSPKTLPKTSPEQSPKTSPEQSSESKDLDYTKVVEDDHLNID